MYLLPCIIILLLLLHFVFYFNFYFSFIILFQYFISLFIYFLITLFFIDFSSYFFTFIYWYNYLLQVILICIVCYTNHIITNIVQYINYVMKFMVDYMNHIIISIVQHIICIYDSMYSAQNISHHIMTRIANILWHGIGLTVWFILQLSYDYPFLKNTQTHCHKHTEFLPIMVLQNITNIVFIHNIQYKTRLIRLEKLKYFLKYSD